MPTPRVLDGPSQFARVKYYRCDECGHVWTISLDGKAIMEHVTPLDEARMGSVTPRSADSDR